MTFTNADHHWTQVIRIIMLIIPLSGGMNRKKKNGVLSEISIHTAENTEIVGSHTVC